jgi:colanic acid/amylovoran biosynthesis glycosyltransferase
MLIYVFVEYYPSVYKSYFDTQFAQFLKDGHEVRIFAHGEMGSQRSRKVLEWELESKVEYYPDSPGGFWRSYRSLLNSIIREPGRAARVLRLDGKRRLRSRLKGLFRALLLPTRAPDFCLIHNLSPALDMHFLKKVYSQTPIALFYHGGEPPRWSSPVSSERVEAVFGMADVVFTNTEAYRSRVIERGCDPGKVVVLPVGFDLADFVPDDPRRYRSGNSLRLITAGRLSEEKGVRYAIEALALLSPEERRAVHYTIVGDGYLRKELEDLVEVRGLTDIVCFEGTRSFEDTIQFLGQADLLILPSIEFGNSVENQGCVVQEALLMKTPAITTRVGGVPESIPATLKQFSCAGADAVALRDMIRRVMSLNSSDLQEIGYEGRLWVARHYDIETLNDRLIQTVAPSDVAGFRA